MNCVWSKKGFKRGPEMGYSIKALLLCLGLWHQYHMLVSYVDTEPTVTTVDRLSADNDMSNSFKRDVVQIELR